MDPRWLFGIVSNKPSTPEKGPFGTKGHESSSKFINFRCELLGYINLAVLFKNLGTAPHERLSNKSLAGKYVEKPFAESSFTECSFSNCWFCGWSIFCWQDFSGRRKLSPPSSGRDRALDEENRNYKFENATWFGPISACSAFHLCLNRLCWKWMSQWEKNWTSVRVFCFKNAKFGLIFFGWSEWPFLCGGVVGGKKSSNL